MQVRVLPAVLGEDGTKGTSDQAIEGKALVPLWRNGKRGGLKPRCHTSDMLVRSQPGALEEGTADTGTERRREGKKKSRREASKARYPNR